MTITPSTKVGRSQVPSLPSSSHAFQDGGTCRIEIPSVEGPAVMAAVRDEADRLDVPVHMWYTPFESGDERFSANSSNCCGVRNVSPPVLC
jgi:hypothetical protein